MEDLLKAIGITALAGCVCMMLQYFFYSAKGQKQIRKRSHVDYTYWLIENTVLGFVIKFVIALSVTIILLFGPGMLDGVEIIKSQDFYTQFIIAIVIIDFAGYWVHRMFHKGWGWKLHSIHHSSKELDWISAARFHPIESLTVIVLLYLTSSVFFGFTNPVIGSALFVRAMYGYFVHANIRWNMGPLRFLLTSPVFHRWHHTQEKDGIDKNFGGLFSIWDHLFGTTYLPDKGRKQPHNFGVKADVGNSFLRQLIYPFPITPKKLPKKK